MTVRVQENDFDVSDELALLRKGRSDIGAITSFVGLVRDSSSVINSDSPIVLNMTLEHYPGMTEKALEAIVEEAKSRWSVTDALIIHRVGLLQLGEQIVFVAVTSQHRGDAFAACEFMMDYLKTEAPFWKKEQTENGANWVEAKSTDDKARDRWKNK